MIKMRKLRIESENAEVQVGTWEIYLNNQGLTGIISENMEHGTFKAKITILIEEVKDDFIIESNYVAKELDLEVEEDEA
jgi:hypothetical protein